MMNGLLSFFVKKITFFINRINLPYKNATSIKNSYYFYKTFFIEKKLLEFQKTFSNG